MKKRNMDKWLLSGSAQDHETTELSDEATSRLTLWPSTVPGRTPPSFAAGPQNLPNEQNPRDASSAQLWPAMNPAAEFQPLIPPENAPIRQSPAPNLSRPVGTSTQGLQGPPLPSSWSSQAQPSWRQRTMEFPRPQSDALPTPQNPSGRSATMAPEDGTYQQLWIAQLREENARLKYAIASLIKALMEDRKRVSKLEAKVSSLEAKVEEPQQASSSNRLFERGHGEGPSTSLVLGPPLGANTTRDRATDQQNFFPFLSQLGEGTNAASSSAAHAGAARNSNSGRPGSGAYEESRRNVPSLGSQGLYNRSDGVGAFEDRAPSWTLDAVVRSAVGQNNEMVEDENLGTEENDRRNDAAQ